MSKYAGPKNRQSLNTKRCAYLQFCVLVVENTSFLLLKEIQFSLHAVYKKHVMSFSYMNRSDYFIDSTYRLFVVVVPEPLITKTENSPSQ